MPDEVHALCQRPIWSQPGLFSEVMPIAADFMFRKIYPSAQTAMEK
jgi:hypothetical protein